MEMKFFRFIILILLFFGFTNILSASLKTDSLYIKPFQRKISARVFIGIKELSIAISSSSKFNSSDPKIIYKPNNGVVGGVGVSYRNILISYYYKVSGTELNSRLYGKTSIADYQINLTNRFFYISVFHRNYSGFYVSKPYQSYPNWEAGTPNPQRPDIKYTTRGIETTVNLNPSKYSLNTSLKLTEQQLQSVFSTLVYANYSLTTINADSSLIPSHLSSSFFDGKKLIQSDFSGWTVMPGLSYCFARNQWFFNPMFFAGIGYIKKELLFANDGEEKYNDYYFRISGRLSCGYNSKLFFAGAIVEWNEMFIPEKNLMIKTENFNVMLMCGIRF